MNPSRKWFAFSDHDGEWHPSGILASIHWRRAMKNGIVMGFCHILPYQLDPTGKGLCPSMSGGDVQGNWSQVNSRAPTVPESLSSLIVEPGILKLPLSHSSNNGGSWLLRLRNVENKRKTVYRNMMKYDEIWIWYILITHDHTFCVHVFPSVVKHILVIFRIVFVLVVVQWRQRRLPALCFYWILLMYLEAVGCSRV